jgi:hypothetical protein
VVPILFYQPGKIFEQKSPAGKKRAEKHHAGQKVYRKKITTHPATNLNLHI